MNDDQKLMRAIYLGDLEKVRSYMPGRAFDRPGDVLGYLPLDVAACRWLEMRNPQADTPFIETLDRKWKMLFETLILAGGYLQSEKSRHLPRGKGRGMIDNWLVINNARREDHLPQDFDTPITASAVTWNTEEVARLIKNGADVSGCNERGASPLLRVFDGVGEWHNLCEAVNQLLDFGADIKYCGDYLLQQAAKHSHLRLVSECLRTKRSQAVLNDSLRAAMFDEGDCTQGCEARKIIRLLLQAGADPNHEFYDGETILSHCQLIDYLGEGFDDLVAFGADVNYTDSQGVTILMKACQHRPYLCGQIQELQTSQLDVNATDHEGRNAIFYAINSGDDSAELVSWLISAGCRIDICDIHGETPLDLALRIAPGAELISMLKLQP